MNSSTPPGLTVAGGEERFNDKTCSYCGSSRVITKYKVGEHRILRCLDCTFMWLYPRPRPDDLHSVYDDSYFKNTSFFDDISHLYGYYDYFGERFTKQSAYLEILRDVKKHLTSFENGKSRFLDIGCGMGYLMDVAHDEGFRVAGVEFNAAAAARLRSKYVFPVYSGNVLDYHDEPYDVVALMDVIEHFTDAELTTAHIATLVKPGGLLVLTTMDCDGIVSRILGARIEDFRRVREHLFFFTRKLIRDLLKRDGFEVIQIKYHGHHFRLGFLADRMTLVSPTLGRLMRFCVRRLYLEETTVHVNPLTKMRIYARRLP
jgi:SAM-dependent methyltransferase